MPELRRDRLERRHQIAQHQSLVSICSDRASHRPGSAPHRARRRPDGWRPAIRSRPAALGGIGEIDGHMAGAVQLARLAPRQCNHLASAGPAKCRKAALPTRPVAPATTIFCLPFARPPDVDRPPSRWRPPRQSDAPRRSPADWAAPYDFGGRIAVASAFAAALCGRAAATPLIPGNRLSILRAVRNV